MLVKLTLELEKEESVKKWIFNDLFVFFSNLLILDAARKFSTPRKWIEIDVLDEKSNISKIEFEIKKSFFSGDKSIFAVGGKKLQIEALLEINSKTKIK